MAFLDKMKVYLDKGVEVSKEALSKGVEVSKEALSKAGEAVQDFSDKSVTKIEAHQLVSRQNKEYRALGLAVRKFFEENPTGSLTGDNSLIQGILQEIARLEKEITEREESLEKAKDEKSGEEAVPTDSFTGSANTGPFTAADASGFEDSSDATDAEFTKSD